MMRDTWAHGHMEAKCNLVLSATNPLEHSPNRQLNRQQQTYLAAVGDTPESLFSLRDTSSLKVCLMLLASSASSCHLPFQKGAAAVQSRFTAE